MNNRFFFSLVMMLTAAVCAVASTSNDKEIELLRESLTVTPSFSYQGFMSYSRTSEDSEWRIFANVIRLNENDKQIVMQSPLVLKDIRMLMHDRAMWVTELDEERQRKVGRAVKPISWYNVFDEVDQFQIDNVDLLLKNYDVRKEKETTIAGRKATCLKIYTRERDRPHARVWIDHETKRHLKYIYTDCDSDTVESFELIDFVPLEDGAVPEWDLAGLKVIGRFDEADQHDETYPFALHHSKNIPEGFEFHSRSQWESSRGIVVHTLLTDGLTRLSLFQRLLTEKELREQEDGKDHNTIRKYRHYDRVIYTRTVDGFRFSAVGDLDGDELASFLSKLKPINGL